MSLAALLLSAAVFVFSMEMWSRTHPPPSLEAQAADTAQWTDRFAIPDSGAPVPAVSAYLDFVAASPHGGLIHNYVNQGMRKLTRALMGISGLVLRVGVVDRMQVAMGRYVDSLQAHPRWALDPGRVRPAMLMAVEILGSLNLPDDPVLRDHVRRAKEAAMALDPAQSMLWQRTRVQEFFIQAGKAVVLAKGRAVAGGPGP